jgi:hypothetical protein
MLTDEEWKQPGLSFSLLNEFCAYLFPGPLRVPHQLSLAHGRLRHDRRRSFTMESLAPVRVVYIAPRTIAMAIRVLRFHPENRPHGLCKVSATFLWVY